MNFEEIFKIEASLNDSRKTIREKIEQTDNEKIKVELLKFHKKLMDAQNHILKIQLEINKESIKEQRDK